MENNGLAFAAPASYALPDGLAMNHTSNHFAAQQMDFSDTANMFATPVKTSVDRGAEVSAQHSYDSTNLSIAKDEEKPQPKDEGMKGQTDRETGSASAPKMEELQREGDQHDYSTLDTPARPTVDHGIESSVRDTLDMSVPEHGLFKVESAPQSGLENLELYDGLPMNGEVQETENMADPSTFTASPTVVEEEPSLHQAYAMLKFPDSYFYVKSTNVMITRDETFRRIYHETKKQKRLVAKMQRAAQQSLDDYAREPSHHSQYGGDDEEDMIGRPARGLLSTYSDVGGAVSYDNQGNGVLDPAAFVHHSRKNKHNSSSNHSIAPRSLHEFEHGDELEGDLYLDKEGRTHDPHEWTQVAIHPQRPEDIDKISREHLIIRYDGDKRSWVMDVIGNRVLHNGQLRNRGESDIDLSHEDEIIIISVSFKFMLPADEDPDVMESVEWDDDLETSPAARRMTDTIDDIESDMDDDSSEEDVPLAQQAKPKKVKAKKTKKTKEPKPKREPVKLKLKNTKVEVPDSEDKKEKQKGKAPAKSGGKTGGKVPAKAVKSTPKEAEQPAPQTEPTEPEAAKPTAEQQPAPSTEAQLVEFAQSGQAPLPPQGPPTQASPPAPINLDPNSAFAGADPSQLPQKRKGPGRPPKNGLISKRDDAGVKRKIKEYERANMAIPPMNELLELVRVEQRQKDAAAKAASRGEAAPDAGMQNIDPRMQSYSVSYTSAAPSQPPQSLPAGTDSPHDLPQAAARSTSPRPRRPAKSPSPMPPQETFSEDQLKKPTITYVFIIDEILQDPALDGQADLQTIYDKIQKRWPYYKYGTTTNGWQSSVRHNLLQCPRFVESGKSGKGKYWKINFEHELDPKKRKQATPPPQGPPRSGPPYQQPYNGSYAQGGSMYNAPFNQGAYPAAGPSGTAQPSHQNGQPGQQPLYGSQPPNGNRMPSQQPPAVQAQPQPFATIVQAIVAYRTEYLQPHAGKDTHSGAEAQFNQALNHYSEVHAGHTPATEGKIDESQDPFRSMKQIFIDFGQGDTRATQNGSAGVTTPAPASGAAPTAVPGPANPKLSSNPATSSSPATASSPAPAAVTSAPSTSAPGTAPATTFATPSQPAQPMANAQPRPAAPISNSNTSTPPMHIQQVQPPPAMSNLPPKPRVSAPSQTQAPTTRPVAAANLQTTSTPSVVGTGPQSRAPTAPMQKQASVARPITAASVQNPSAAPAISTAPQSQASQAPAQMQTSATRPSVTPPQASGPTPASRPVNPATQVPASRPVGTAQAASMMPTSQSPAAALSMPSSHVGQQQMGQNSAPVARAPVAPRPQQPPQVSSAQTAVQPAQQQPKQAVVSSTPQPPSQTQRQPMQQPTSSVAGADTRPQHSVAATNGTVPLAQRVPTSQAQQQISPVQKVAPSGLNEGTSASLPAQVPQAPLPNQPTAKQEPQADVRPSSAGVKRPAEETSEDQASKRARTSPATQPASQNVLPEVKSDTRPASAGVKRNADGDNDDGEAKRLKV